MKDERHTETLKVRMPPRLFARLRAAAEHEERTLSDYVREIVRRALGEETS